ncbi:MAG: hypothetical protein IJV69_04995 [Kiritimatiellae bacterium]|nr:hypothetical protein [Kiritimatiellia bacterium]
MREALLGEAGAEPQTSPKPCKDDRSNRRFTLIAFLSPFQGLMMLFDIWIGVTAHFIRITSGYHLSPFQAENG